MRLKMASGGSVDFRLRTRAVAVTRRSRGGARVAISGAHASWRGGLAQGVEVPRPHQQPDEVIECDELIMACPANVALSLLRDPSRAERRCKHAFL